LVSSPWLSFIKRFLIALVVVSAVASLGVMSSESAAKQKFEASRKVHVPGLTPVQPGKPANFLLIGSDSRAGEGAAAEAQTPGQRSDVVMVLHVDPKSRTGMLVSFPRDLLVQIPGHGRDLLAAAFGYGGPGGGPTLVKETLEANFPPLKINHYIEVNFEGFKSIVDAIGKIHLYFPTPVHDPFSGLNIDTAGCNSVDGTTALAYARSRHYYIPDNPQNPAPWVWNYSPDLPESAYHGGSGWMQSGRADLDRIPRQQYFLRTISQAAIDKTAANPTKLFGLFDAVSKNFSRDDSLTFNEMKALIRTFNGLNPRKVEMLTLPVTGAPPPNQAHVVATDSAQAVLSQLMTFGGQSPPNPPLLPPGKVNVRVVNGTTTPGAGQRAADELAAAGYHVTGPSEDADRADYEHTQIRYAPDKFQPGLTLAADLKTMNLFPAPSRTSTLNADVLLIVGADYDKLKKIPTAAQPGSSISTTTTTAPVLPSTTSTTLVPQVQPDPRFVPTDLGGAPLVGCPSK
jgi:LCP family protein required for cell wall assembly